MGRRKVLRIFGVLSFAFLASSAFGQTFSVVQNVSVGPSPIKIVTADFNNDGIPDLLTLDNGGNSVSPLLGKGDGTFTPASHQALNVAQNISGTDIDAVDITHDGKIDLAIYHSGYPDGATTANLDYSYTFIGRGDGTFKLPPAACPCMATTAKPGPMVLGDLNGRGNYSMTQAMYTPAPNNQVLGGIRIAFGSDQVIGSVGGIIDTGAVSQNGTGTTVTDPVIIDFNDDGHLDIGYAMTSLAQPTSQLSFLTNQANAVDFPNFSNPQVFDTLHLPITRITTADMNADGKLDMILTYSGCNGTCQGFTIYINQGAGKFQRGPEFSLDPAIYGSPSATAVADFNRDKRNDIAFLTRKTNGNPAQAIDAVVIFAANADATFAQTAEIMLDRPGENFGATNLVVGDWNKDGLPDLAVASSIENKAVVALNVPPPPDFALALSASSLTVNSGSSGNLNVSVSAMNAFNAAVSLSCTGLPAHAACAFAPPELTPGSAAGTSVL